jgi:hypothetical protein
MNSTIPLLGGVPFCGGEGAFFSKMRSFSYRGIEGTPLSPPSMGKDHNSPPWRGAVLRRGGCLSVFPDYSKKNFKEKEK